MPSCCMKLCVGTLGRLGCGFEFRRDEGSYNLEKKSREKVPSRGKGWKLKLKAELPTSSQSKGHRNEGYKRS